MGGVGRFAQHRRAILAAGVTVALVTGLGIVCPRAVSVAAPAPPQPVALVPATSATNYAENADHNSSVADPITSDVTPLWSKDLGGVVSYPLEVDGRVFVVASKTGANYIPEGELVALDARTGTELWPPLPVGVPSALTAYDQGRLFAASNQVYAVDPATGGVLWSVANPTSEGVNSLVAANGYLYESVGTSVVVFAEADGHQVAVWNDDYAFGGEPAVDSSGLYVTDGAADSTALNLPGGSVRWHSYANESSGPSEAVVGGGLMWRAAASNLEGASEATGATQLSLPDFVAGYDQLAVSDSTLFTTHQSQVAASSLPSGTTMWTATASAPVQLPPVVTPNAVFDLDNSGNLAVLNPATGATLNVVHLTPPKPLIAPLSTTNAMAVGQGLLVVPDGNTLTVLHSSATALPPSAPVTPPQSLPVGPAHTGLDMSAATTFAQSASHNAVGDGSSITAQLRRRWSRTFPSAVSYSLVSGTNVYTAAGGSVYDLDRRTGATIWGPIPVEAAAEVRLTLDGTSLFALSNGGYVAALDVGNGAVLWRQHLQAYYGFAGSPTVADGLVFVEGDTAGYGGLGFALREKTGALAYIDDVASSEGDIAPTLGAFGQLFYNGGCSQVYAVAPRTGRFNWHYGNCTGGGLSGAVFAAGALYVDGGLVLRPSNGTETGNVQRQGRVVVDQGAVVALSGPDLIAASLGSDQGRYWSFSGDGTLATDPVIANNLVFAEGTSGRAWALNESTGTVVWSAMAGPQNLTITDGGRVAPSVGAGTLLVPDGGTLTAFAG